MSTAAIMPYFKEQQQEQQQQASMSMSSCEGHAALWGAQADDAQEVDSGLWLLGPQAAGAGQAQPGRDSDHDSDHEDGGHPHLRLARTSAPLHRVKRVWHSMCSLEHMQDSPCC